MVLKRVFEGHRGNDVCIIASWGKGMDLGMIAPTISQLCHCDISKKEKLNESPSQMASSQ